MEARVSLAEALSAARSGGARITLLPALVPSRSIGGHGQFAWRQVPPPADNKCRAVWTAWWSDLCNSEVVPVAGGNSAHCNVGRARDGSQAMSRAAASKTPMVSARTCPLHARVFQAFALGVSHGWSTPLHSSIPSCPFDIRISSGSSQRAAHDGLYARVHTCRVARALLAICSRAERWPAPFMGSKRPCRASRRRALCVKASMQSLLYINKHL